MGTGFVGIFLPINMILLTISLVDKFLKLNFKVTSQVSLTRVSSSETTDMLFSIYMKFFIRSSFALNWLLKGPKEVMDEGSPAWNKGRIFYTNAPKEVVDEYATKFAMDMESFFFLEHELVIGGLLAVIIPAALDGMSNWDTFTGTELDVLGYCLMDMAKVVRKRNFNSSSLTLFGEILDKLGVTFNKLK